MFRNQLLNPDQAQRGHVYGLHLVLHSCCDGPEREYSDILHDVKMLRLVPNVMNKKLPSPAHVYMREDYWCL